MFYYDDYDDYDGGCSRFGCRIINKEWEDSLDKENWRRMSMQKKVGTIRRSVEALEAEIGSKYKQYAEIERHRKFVDRQKLMDFIKADTPIVKIAEYFDVSRNTIYRSIQEYRLEGYRSWVVEEMKLKKIRSRAIKNYGDYHERYLAEKELREKEEGLFAIYQLRLKELQKQSKDLDKEISKSKKEKFKSKINWQDLEGYLTENKPTITEMARKYKISRGTVYHYIKKYSTYRSTSDILDNIDDMMFDIWD